MGHMDTMIAWLNDAHAMENNLIQVLENHVKDARDHPQAQAKIQQHLDQTRRHAELVKGCIEQLGGRVSAVKSGLGAVTGAFQGISTGAAKDELIKNALADYASEHLEIASYRALITGAQAVGHPEIARICEQILRDEEDMARWLDQQLPMMVQEYIGQQTMVHGVA